MSASSQNDDLEKIRYDIALHLAKSILADGIGSGKRYFTSLISLGVFLIPAYVTILRLFSENPSTLPRTVVFVPLSVWVGAIILCGIRLFPKYEMIDFKNIDSIIEHQSSSLKTDALFSRISGVLLLMGALISSYNILYCV